MVCFQDSSTLVKNVSGTHLKLPAMGELEEAKLFSCLDVLRDRMGDALIEQEAIDAILEANFDAEKALDQLLGKSLATADPIRVAPKASVKAFFPLPAKGKENNFNCFGLF